MTIRYLTVLRTVFVALTAAAIVCVPLTSAVAQRSIGDHRNEASGFATKDGTETLHAEGESGVKSIRSYARSNYIWPYASGPSYPAVDVYQKDVVWTPAGTFRLGSDLPIASELRSSYKLDAQAGQYFVVQYHDEVTDENELGPVIEASGGRIVASPNSGSVVAFLTRGGYEAVQSSVGFIAVEPYHAAFKLNASIGRTPMPDPIKALSDVYTLGILLWPGEEASAAAEAVGQIGGSVVAIHGDTLIVEAHRALLGQIAGIDAVQLVQEQLPMFTQGEETTAIVQTALAPVSGVDGSTPYHDEGITGAGLNLCEDLTTACTSLTAAVDCNGIGGESCLAEQVIMVLDSGFSLDAGDLSDTRTDAGTPGPAHRKVRVYEATNQFGGQGDTTGCDAPPQGGFTHGHLVASTALGAGTTVGGSYGGAGWNAFDTQGNAWEIDGVAYDAVLVGYDASVTPPNGSCEDPGQGGILSGDLYNPSAPANGGCPGAATCPGSLGKAYEEHGARLANLSYGSQANEYSLSDIDVDNFILQKGDAMVFISAGNYSTDIDPPGGDSIPDPLTLGSPGTTKNGFAIGASRNAGGNAQESRAGFSSVGPAVNFTANRIAPQLMAPGADPGNPLGVHSEFSCRSNDNDQNNPVVCDTTTGRAGTSFSSPAAAGAAALVLDYFRQGFYPSAQQNDADSRELGAAALKALLVNSADFMSGANLTRAHRWNNEQGYGRITLTNALPLQASPRSPLGALLNDPHSGGVADLGLPFTISTGDSFSTTFDVVNDDEPLRLAIAWLDPTNFQLRHDLNMTVISPTGVEYRGNYFTDDNNQNGVPEANEDCGGIGAENPDAGNGLINEDQWSIPVCSNTNVLGKSQAVRPFDNSNPTEAIFLSPDPQNDDSVTGGLEGLCTAGSENNANGPCDNSLDCRNSAGGVGICVNQDDYKQTEIGTWELHVFAGAGAFGNAQEFAAYVSGGVALGSNVRFDRGAYTCNEETTITVTEVEETGTEGTDLPTEVDVEARITVEVYDESDVLVDSEEGINFTKDPNGLKYESDAIQLTDNTAREFNNGALDVRDGDSLRVRYADADVDTPGLPLTVLRTNQASVDCRVNVGFGSIVFAQYGQDSSLLVQGGCERNVRGEFFFGFPDRYMDADESIILNFAFNSNEQQDLESVVAELSCVKIDADSPGDCLPSGDGCDETECGGPCDPRRENNLPCDELSILDSPNFIGFVPANAAMAANFAIQMAGDGPGEPFEDTGGGQPTPTVEMILQVEAAVSGQTRKGLAISRQRLNIDPTQVFYSTDYPDGGSEVLDHGPGNVGNNDEIASDPITENANFQTNDYRFETWNFAPMTVGGKNQNLLSPWNFDGNNGGWTVGLAAAADETTADIFNIANWGEDKNFNNIEDGVCEDNPAIACYDFGTDTDPRCPASTDFVCGPNQSQQCTGTCSTVEDNAGGTSFVNNWNTKGGCGWQTRATGECTLDATRGCFNNEDCLGTCHVLNNDIASTFAACGSGLPCAPAQACSDLIPNPNPLSPCTSDADCGDVAGACVNVSQTCLGDGGTCGSVVLPHTGGVWHTGQIGNLGDTCNGQAGSACANYKVIGGGNAQLLWWELLVSPVMEKVNTNIGADGLPEAQIEIRDMGWNTNINLSDSNAAYSWEIDTDLETLDPVDLFSDTTILGLGGGSYGAIALGSNPDLTNGWPIFGTQCTCSTGVLGPCQDLFDCETGTCTVSGNDCHVDADCVPGQCTGTGGNCFSDDDCVAGTCDNGGDGTALGQECHTNADCEAIAGVGATCTGAPETCDAISPEGCVNAPTCDCLSGDTTNGSIGNNRVGDAGCFFEGNIAAADYINLGLSRPLDDDQDNDGDAVTDEYVQDDGPYRNHDVVAFNGPDMRFGTLEDIFGDTGETFQAALGFINFEGSPASQATQSYGVAVDDVVVKWREFTLDPDVTDCDTSGSCAVIELTQANVFQGQAVLTITVLDAVPDPENDCDLDGALDGTNDCNGNSIADVVVKATSEVEVTGEITFLDNQGGSEYKGSLAISSLADGPGVLFVAQDGADFPTVSVSYQDNDIDPSAAVEKCPNDVDPNKHGNITGATTVFLGSFCDVTLVAAETTDNGDGDEFVDTEETVDMAISLLNNCGIDLHNCTGRLFSNSENVDCIVDSVIDIGDLLDTGGTIEQIADQFRWKMADVQRADPNDIFDAEFSFTMVCDEIDAVQNAQTITLPLDLDLDDLGQTPVAWNEGFEGGFGDFVADNLDAGIPGANNIEGLINGQGWRCQYSDPDWPNSNSYGEDVAEDCFPGATLDQSNAIWWAIDGTGTGAPDGGRAKSGSFSMYYGAYLPADSDFTTPLATMESVSTVPINLGVGNPELSWWQQISLMDGRSLNTPSSRSADRGVVQYQTVDAGGDPTSDWVRLEPFQNSYDTQNTDFYFNCMFDPVDDGNTEDDFFDPTDPDRRLGPSSTCFPEFTYTCLGDTDEAFQVGNICNAATQPGPGDAGDLGTGTWIESKVDLTPLKGRRLKVRYMVATIKGTSETHDDQFDSVNPGPGDDGWWLDDVSIDETLTNPALLLADTDDVLSCEGGTSDVGCLSLNDCINAGVAGPCAGDAPKCGATCTSVTATVVTDPDNNGGAGAEELSAPGQPIELDATTSSGQCLDGALQYKFTKDGTVLREFSENAVLVDAPGAAAQYVVDVRCSTDTACADQTTVDVTVICPTGDTPLLGVFPETVVATSGTTWGWTASRGYDLLQGPLGGVSSYAGTRSTGTGNSFSDPAALPGGTVNGKYYVVRELGGFCNEIGSWTTGGAGECAGGICDRDTDITP